jgi:hypothetical protein
VAADALPSLAQTIIDASSTGCVVSVSPEGWPQIEPCLPARDGEALVLGLSKTAAALEDAEPGSGVAVLLDVGERFEELRGTLLRASSLEILPALPNVLTARIVRGGLPPSPEPLVGAAVSPTHVWVWDLAGPWRDAPAEGDEGRH